MAVCQACGKKLRWARTVNGKRMPLNVNPDPAGNVVLDGDGIARVLSGTELEVARQVRPMFMPHHATCSHAEEFRRARSEAQ